MEDFEKDIKDFFRQREIKPSANAWQRMEALVEEQKTEHKKPKTLFYFLSVAASVLLFVGLWIFFQKTNQSQLPETKVTESFVVDTKKEVVPSVKKDSLNTKFVQHNEQMVAHHKPQKKTVVDKVLPKALKIMKTRRTNMK